MKTIDEIFESNPKLLEEKEVIELIEQFRIQYSALRKKYYDLDTFIIDVCLNSEIYVKGGTSYKKALISILKKIE